MRNTLSHHLNDSIILKNDNRVDESIILATIICSACVAYTASPVLNTDFMKSVGAGMGGLLGGLGGLFGSFGGKKDEIKDLLKKNPDDLTGKEKEKLLKISKNDKLKKEFTNNELKALDNIVNSVSKENKIEKEDEPQYTPEIMSGLMLLAKKANDEEKDKTNKAENDAMLNILSACSYDKDGKEIPMSDRLNKMKDIVGEDKWDTFKADMEKKYEENKDNEEFKKALENAKNTISEKDVETFIADTKSRAKKTLEKVAKDKEEQEKIDKELERIQTELNDKNKTQDELKKLKEDLDKLNNKKAELITNSLVGIASPTTAEAIIKTGKNDDEHKNDDDDEHKKSTDDIEKEYKEKSKELEKEYQEKIDKEEDKDKKKELEDEWEKKEAKLSAEKNKQLDSKYDNDDHNTEKDETKQGKYKVKDEEVTDPETGKKIKVKTYTGPRGGKFYYPDGKPKKPENKVYLECLSNMNTHLSSCITPLESYLKYNY